MVVHLALTFFPNQRPEIKCVYSHADVDQVGLISQLMKLEVHYLKDLSEKGISHGYLLVVVCGLLSSVPWLFKHRTIGMGMKVDFG